LGGTAGRTTLNGEGLQHEDGHSHLMSATIPNCISYDPTYGHEVAVIVQDGLRRMFTEQEDVFYYLTLMNENYEHPAMPEGVEQGIVKGLYRFSKAETPGDRHVNLMSSGTIFQQAMKAAELLQADFGITSDLWVATSMNELARDGQDAERWNLLHPAERQRVPFVAQQLEKFGGPVIASTDYMKNYAEQIRPFVPQTFHTLGTDGFGRSDSRANLRRHFEVDANHIAATAVYALFKEGKVSGADVEAAYAKYAIDPAKINPRTA
ncbi:MAG: transketolase-like TK C-terminal-containing protein, partial [Gammaproteobacteria bacterium]